MVHLDIFLSMLDMYKKINHHTLFIESYLPVVLKSSFYIKFIHSDVRSSFSLHALFSKPMLFYLYGKLTTMCISMYNYAVLPSTHSRDNTTLRRYANHPE